MASIQFDSTELVNSTYIPRYIKHETIPERDLSLLQLAREDGAVLVNSRYGVKKIVISGKLTATTQTKLEHKIDEFKELFSRKAKNLDIEYGYYFDGTDIYADVTRRYVATCINHNFDRDHFHLLYVPWSAEFIIPDGVGTYTSTETMYSIGSAEHSDSFTITASAGQGSAPPKPYFIELDCCEGFTGNGCRGFTIEANDKKLIYTQSSELTNGDKLVINTRDKTVKLNGTEVNYHGEFPEFDVGDTDVTIEKGRFIIEETISKSSAHALSNNPIHTDNYEAQGILMPWKDQSVYAVEVGCDYTNSPPNDLTIRIETDSDGVPSGSLVDANATTTISTVDIDNDSGVVLAEFSGAFTLEADTRYWIVYQTSGGDSGNAYYAERASDDNNLYPKGIRLVTVDGGTTWEKPSFNKNQDLYFALYIGGNNDGGVMPEIKHYPRFL